MLLCSIALILTCFGCGTSNPNSYGSNCDGSRNTAEWAEPECLILDNPDTDLFVTDETVYMRLDTYAENLQELRETIGEQLRTFHRTEVSEDFESWDATRLPVGTKVFSSDQPTILVAKINGELIAYQSVHEG
jgi:hypothetical protein